MLAVAPRSEVSQLEIRTGSATHGFLPDHWRWPGLLLTASFLAVLGLFWQTVRSMGETWYSSRTYNHGFLVLPLFLYLIWVRRGRLAAVRPTPTYWPLSLLAVLASVWLLGNLAEVRVVQEFALVAMLVTLVWVNLGPDVVHALRFPLAFLFFAVPFGQSLIGPLQDYTAWFAVHALTLSGVPVVLEHRILSLPSGSWEVAEACSGIRYLISSLVLGLIYTSVMYRSPKRRVIFVAASIAVPIAANGMRAYGIILLAHLTDNRLAVGVDHIVYGWLFFTAIQVALFAIGLKWRESPGAEDGSVSARPSDVAGFANQHVPSAKAALIVAMAGIVLVGVPPLAAAHLWSRATASAGWSEQTVDVHLPWQPAPTYDMSWAPDLRGADRVFSQSYKAGEDRVDLYQALYSGRDGVNLVGNYNLLANPRLWEDLADGFENAVIDGRTISVHRSLLESGGASRLVWTWYWIDGEYTANPGQVKFLQAKARFLGRPSRAAVIALGTDFQAEPAEGRRILQDFLSHTSLSTTVPPRPR